MKPLSLSLTAPAFYERRSCLPQLDCERPHGGDLQPHLFGFRPTFMCYVPSPVLASVGDTGESRGAGRSAELGRTGSPPTARPPAPRQEGQCPVEHGDHFSPPDWERPGAGPSGSVFHWQLLRERSGLYSLLHPASGDVLLVPNQGLSLGVRRSVVSLNKRCSHKVCCDLRELTMSLCRFWLWKGKMY